MDSGAAPSYLSSGSQHASTSRANASTVQPKCEDVIMRNALNTKPTLYTVYSTAADIAYTPELALKEGLNMVKTIKEDIKKLKLGQLRNDVWLRELQRCEVSQVVFIPLT